MKKMACHLVPWALVQALAAVVSQDGYISLESYSAHLGVKYLIIRL